MTKTLESAVMAVTFCACAFTAKAQDVPFVLFPFCEAVVASPLDSELAEYCYLVGEPFTNGAVIAKLDDARYRIVYQRAREHRDYTAQIAAEQEELRSKDFASEMELRKARYEEKLAAADFAEAELNLRRCLLVAPFNGKIAEQTTQRYETVKPGQPMFRIIQDDRLLAVANLPLGSVKVGDTVRLALDGASATTGTVYEVSPQADNRTGTVRVRVSVENAAGVFAAGMTGMIKFEVPSGESVAPSAAAESDAEPAAETPAVELFDPGISYASVQEVLAGESSRVLTITNDCERYLTESNFPAAWRDCELKSQKVSDTEMVVQAVPSVAITGLRYESGLIVYSLHRYPRSVSLATLKRRGTLVAGLYDDQGNRLACIEPRQVELPGSGQSLQGMVAFPPQELVQASEREKPSKLVIIVESDVRVLQLSPQKGDDE